MTDAREQWLVAGQQLLRRGGAAAVKLTPLTAECGLTSGSFYHHFSGIPAYLDELARYYGTEQTTAFLASVDDADPLSRLRRIHALSRDEQMGPLDAAMRDWAGANPVAASAVKDADAILLRFLEKAFVELDVEEPRVRAHLMLAAGVARISPPWPRVSADRFLAVLTDQAVSAQTMSVGRSGKPRA